MYKVYLPFLPQTVLRNTIFFLLLQTLRIRKAQFYHVLRISTTEYILSALDTNKWVTTRDDKCVPSLLYLNDFTVCVAHSTMLYSLNRHSKFLKIKRMRGGIKLFTGPADFTLRKRIFPLLSVRGLGAEA